jgi:hypothetical protein
MEDKMADRKRENSGAKNSRRNKADPGYGAQIREAERMLTEEQNGENPNNNKSADSTSEKNERSREDTAEQKLAKLAEERSLLIKQLENGLEEREKVVQELTEKLEKMPVGKDCDGTSNEYLSDEDAQKLLERVLEAENGAQKEKAEAEKRIEKARKAAERARKAKQQSDAVIKQAEKEVRDILDEADRKEKAIREEASLKQEHFNITDSKMQEIIDDINSRRPVQETESGTEAADTAVMSPKEKKAYIRAEKKALRERRRAERKKLAETKKLARNGYLPKKTQEQLIEDAIMEMIDENNLFGEARKSVKELVMCDGVDPNNNGYLVLNDSGQDIYVMCMYIEKNKRKNDFAVTYEKLMNTKGVTTSIYIEPMRDGKAVRTMDKRVLILDSEQQGAAKDGDRNRYRKLGSKLRDTEKYADDVESGNNNLYEVSFIFVLWNTSLEQLMIDVNEFHNTALNSGNIELCSCYSTHPEAFLSAAPMNRLYKAGTGLVKTCCVKKHVMDTYSLSCIFNHTRSDFYHENGIIAGRNMSTGRPATFDCYDKMFDSYGVVVCGSTGTGKSATIKMYFTRYADFGVRIASIDFEKVGSRGEYSRACEAVGGQNFVIKVGSEYTINLFELDTQLEYDESTDLEYEDLNVMDKVSDLVNIIYTMATYGKNKPSYDTEVYFEEIIRKIVMELYEERGIHDHDVASLFRPAQLYGERVKKKLPVITDFYKRLLLEQKRNSDSLKDQAYSLLRSAMQSYVRYAAYTLDTLKFFSREEVDLMKRNDIGQVVYEDVEGNSHVVEVVVGTRSFFDGQSTIHVDLDTPWINIDISQMIDADRPIAEAIAANYLNENFVKKNSSNPRKAKKRIIMIDECHKMFPYEHLRLFLADLYRTARKRLISPWVCTQALHDFHGFAETEAILEQTSIMLLLKQEPNHEDYIKKVTRMTDAQIKMLMELGGNPMDKSQGNSRKGELCMIMKGHAAFIKVDYLTDSEFDAVETDMLKIQEMHGRMYKERRAEDNAVIQDVS